MKVSANDLQHLPMPKLREVRKNEIGAVSVLTHFYVILKFGVVDFSSCRVDLRLCIVVTLFIFVVALFLFGFLALHFYLLSVLLQ